MQKSSTSQNNSSKLSIEDLLGVSVVWRQKFTPFGDPRLIPNSRYLNLLGFTKNEELLSQLIRNNAISRQDALKRLETENMINHDLLNEIFAEMDFPSERIYTALQKVDRTLYE